MRWASTTGRSESCLLIWALSLHFDDRLPKPDEIFSQLYLDPLQTRDDLPAAFDQRDLTLDLGDRPLEVELERPVV